MKSITSFVLAIIFTFTAFITVNAQSAETIWLTASTTAFKTGETVIVTVNSISGTPVQGFTFQIRYDPACLQPVNATSPIFGMNGLSLPQSSGLVDASFASTTPQTANGVLAEVRFITLSGCQTNLTLESAALAIRNASGFAAPLAGVTVNKENIALNIDKALGTSDVQPASGTPLPLGPVSSPSAPGPAIPSWIIALIAAVVGIGGAIVVVIKFFKPGSAPAQKNSTSRRIATVQIKRGPLAGKSFSVNKLPCSIGRDPNNEICINDPLITGLHAKIYSSNNEYYLMDIGGETFINGMSVKKSSAVLKSGDTVRLGRNVFFEFAF